MSSTRHQSERDLPRSIRLNLGSGNEPLAEYINVDRRLVSGVDVVADVTRLPFRESCATDILASSLLEHFEDPYSVLDEIHRVLSADGQFAMRVPSPWSYSGQLDKSHLFLADLKLWRQILGGYFAKVRVVGEGVRYRDSKAVAALLHVLVKGFRLFEFAQTWKIHCERPRATASRAYIPWWLEARY
jgi:ubiquinone/menaquinone biosynthesis C-methylase UbiE